MSETPEPLRGIRTLVAQERYRIRIHAVRHMIKEGFSESDIVEVLRSGQLLENYGEEARCVLVGSFAISGQSVSPLHVLCDYSNDNAVDIVTAYIPQKPWWQTETKRGRIQ